MELSKEHFLNLDAGIDAGDSSVKLLNSNCSVAQQYHNLGHSIFLKRYTITMAVTTYAETLAACSLAYPLTSRDKISPSPDERLFFYNPDFGHLAGKKTFGRPKRIKSSLLVMEALSPYKVKMICGICQKHLTRKPYFLGNTLASGEYSVLAVPDCGHLYHADCLEEEDRLDPPCPLCSGSPPQV